MFVAASETSATVLSSSSLVFYSCCDTWDEATDYLCTFGPPLLGILHDIHEYWFTQNMVQTSHWADVSLIGRLPWSLALQRRDTTTHMVVLFPLNSMFRLELASALHQLCSEAASISTSACWFFSCWNKVPADVLGEVFYSAWRRRSWPHISSYPRNLGSEDKGCRMLYRLRSPRLWLRSEETNIDCW